MAWIHWLKPLQNSLPEDFANPHAPQLVECQPSKLKAQNVTPEQSSDSDASVVDARSRAQDPLLTEVVTAWASLPEDVRSTIIALINSVK
jgi:hypothetical protein